MTVLLVIHGVSDPSTAVYRDTMTRARFLEHLGHEARVLTPADLGVTHGRLMPVSYPFAVAWWILRRAPFDTVAFHSHTGWIYQLTRALRSGHRGTRAVVFFHGLDALYVKALADDLARHGRQQTRRFRLLHGHLLPFLARSSCRRADRVFCMNAAEESFLIQQGWTTPDRLRRMPNCVDAAEFAAAPVPRGHGPVRLLTVAQWLPQKGTAYLIEAFAALVRSALDVTLTCVGTQRPAGAVLQDFPEDVRARVTVVPSLAHAEMSQVYAAADVFVLSSIFEGFSIALLEAMAAGLAIVATHAGSAPDILTHGDDALLVPCADAAALETALSALATDPARRQALGARARARAKAFTCDRILPRFAADLLGTEATAEVGAG